ncbi:hypothetical protein [Nocardioides sp. T2.26MG-1]|uniref:hypothetical protein n=1 Tax=Nocardioides sp. T2.26MG-1 TaxID=3041166 RepID=UPI0024774FE4|nr:hypothetical protein [Nocardioides sp. T2.26MG-1]CAI9408279.1 hypothetical protein HIDPHFAB_01047 [Nocardioides sp. T2.26MG-1]
MKRSLLSLPALALAASLLAGCGGSDGSDGKDSAPEPDASAIASADFVSEANQICADGNAEVDSASAELGDAPTEEDVSAFARDVLVPNIQGQHDAIAELGAPEGDQDAVDALLTALQDGIDALTADPTVVSVSPGPFADANAAATELGLTECAG